MHQAARAVAPLNTDPKWPWGYIAVLPLRSSQVSRQLTFGG